MTHAERAALALEVLQATHPESPAIGALSWVLRDTAPVDWASAEIEALASLTEDVQLGRAHPPAEEAPPATKPANLECTKARLAALQAKMQRAGDLAIQTGLASKPNLAQKAAEALASQPPRRHGIPPNPARTPERMELLATLWPQPKISVAEIHRELAKLPGPAMPTSSASIYKWAEALGLPTERISAYGPAAAPEPPPEPDILPEDRAEALEMLRTQTIGAKGLSEYFGWDLDVAQRITGELREELRQEARARRA